MSELNIVNLSEVADIIPGFAFKGNHFGTVGLPVIKITNICPPYIDIENAMKVDISHYDKSRLEKYTISKDDFIIAMTGATIGKIGRLTNNTLAYVNQRVAIIKPNKDVYKRYIYYCLHNNDFQDFIQNNIDSNSAQENISGTSIGRYECTLPPLPEQEAIAGVLSSLDDKIDLLQRQNKTLEAMAETLFRQWFIEEAEDDWGVGKLDDILTVKGGSTPSTTVPEYWNGDIYWTSPRDITSLNQIHLLDTERKISQAGLSKISSGVLPNGTLLMTSRAPVGVLAFAQIPLAINQGYIAIIDNKGYSKEFLYLWLKTNMDYVQSYANGSTFQEISKSSFKSLEMLTPPIKKRLDFQDFVEPIFAKIKSNTLQVMNNRTLKDTLLPKLISGEIKLQI